MQPTNRSNLIDDKGLLLLPRSENKTHGMSDTRDAGTDKRVLEIPTFISNGCPNICIKDSIENLTPRSSRSSQAVADCTSNDTLQAYFSSLQHEGQTAGIESTVSFIPSPGSGLPLPASLELKSRDQERPQTQNLLANERSNKLDTTSPLSCVQRLDASGVSQCKIQKSIASSFRDSLRQRKTSASKRNLDIGASGCDRKASVCPTASITTTRPLSPFTNSGSLRRIGSSIHARRNAISCSKDLPLSAPADVNKIDLTLRDDVDHAMKQLVIQSCQTPQDQKEEHERYDGMENSARKDRGGYSLISALNKRINKRAS